ncbi:hypothetical protein [Chitinophaga ginsengisoli]|uniref:Uncharacterized protein n=1 Tax=Chitinophaga ginsengisoli TaxID=363837 RepID=A0A2P8G2E7_9BACT|nr:hypothetical protein [Chitinophaga ginsengisoli]PSL28164.1 hypothetical protein CLV42_10883 [Chitinophaga ginsengisoli]
MFKRHLPTCIAVCIALLSFGCKKENKLPISSEISAIVKPFGVPAYSFNWEVSDYMPTPPGYSIFVPWANGSVKGFPSDIWYDMKAADGWELVYNEFNPTASSLPANPFFVLYNKYRGVLRIYEYVTTTGFVNSSYLTSGLNLSPNNINSNMLNYIGQDLIDVSVKHTVITKVESTQIATGVWYAAQYEIAYDPSIASSTYQQIGLNWTLKWTNISGVSLGGTSTGTLNGTISNTTNGFNVGSLGTGALEAAGLSVFDNNKGNDANHPGNGNKLGLPASIFEAAQKGMKDGLTGIITNVFSAIFGGSTTTTQQVNLTMNANITLNGTISSNGALIPDPGLGLGVPGTSNSQSAPGLIPFYNKPMGVFYITGKPIVDVTRTEEVLDTSYFTHSFSLEPGSYQIVYNPEVLSIANIQNVRTEVLLIDPPYPATANFQIGSHTAGYAWSVTFGPAGYFDWYWPIAVRIAFDVVPKNGAPKSTIVKTFYATIKHV